MRYVFGPVPSRRLGQSLGIDPVPLKTCNWNCVYCQLGRTKPFVTERKDFFPPDEMVTQVKEALDAHKSGEIDWVTFVGSGETVLHASMGSMIRQVKSFTELSVAVITNGSLLYLPEVRKELSAADAILPSLDAGNEKLYRRVNRPHPMFTFQRLTEGLIAFRKEYHGKLWVEVMLIQNLNDSEKALNEIAEILLRVEPDEVHIVQPTRPPVELWVRPPTQEKLQQAHQILGSVARVLLPAVGSFDLGGSENLVNAIVGIITRHPMSESDLIASLQKWSPGDVSETLMELERSGKAQVVTRYGRKFWSAKSGIYPQSDEEKGPSQKMPGELS